MFMFKRRIMDVPERCEVFVNGKRVEDKRRLYVGKYDSIFFVNLKPETKLLEFSARSQENITVRAQIQFTVSLNDGDSLQDLIKISGLSYYPNIKTLTAKEILENEILPEIKACFVTFAQEKKFLDFQSGNFFNEFSNKFIKKFPEWVNFEIKSIAISPPQEFDDNILADIRARNSDPELISYVEKYIEEKCLLQEEEEVRESDRRRRENKRREDEEEEKNKLDFERTLRANDRKKEAEIQERQNQSDIEKLDQARREENAQWQMKFLPIEEKLEKESREREKNTREFVRAQNDQDAQAAIKRKNDDAQAAIKIKNDDEEAKNRRIVESAKAEAIAAKAKTEANEAVKKELEILARKSEIEVSAIVKILNELANVTANMSGLRGVFVPDYSGVHTIINSKDGDGNDILMTLFTGVLTKFCDSYLGSDVVSSIDQIMKKKAVIPNKE